MAPVPPPSSALLNPPPATLPQATEAAADGIMVKAQRFFEENQKAILIGCGVAVAAGAGYYLYSTSGSKGSAPGPSAGSSSSSTAAPAEKSSSSKNKKKKKSKKSDKFLKGEGTDGPLLEEIKPKATDKKAEDKAVEDPFEGGLCCGFSARSWLTTRRAGRGWHRGHERRGAQRPRQDAQGQG